MNYLARITDAEIKRKLEGSGAVLVKGPKASGKTESAKQFAKSVLRVDQSEQVQQLINIDPQRLLKGEVPRLIDEWQVHPKLWDYVRHEVDERKQMGQFILTGSSTPDEGARIHSGSGRYTVVTMRTLSWQELGFATGAVKLSDLMLGQKITTDDEAISLDMVIERIVVGGFPALIGKSVSQAIDLNRAYIELLTDIDMSKVGNTKRDPSKVKNLLRSMARNTATICEISNIVRDIFEADADTISRPTIYDYLDALDRLMIVEDQPAWNTHLRSSSSLRKTPKRHFTDVALAVASIGADTDSLFNDLRFTGFLFESMVIHDLRVYSQTVDGKVYHYRDSSGLEIDAIIQKYNGEWCAFEIKLGTDQIEAAAANLHKLVSVLDAKRVKPPKSLNIIVGVGISYTRADGINVISFASLGI